MFHSQSEERCHSAITVKPIVRATFQTTCSTKLVQVPSVDATGSNERGYWLLKREDASSFRVSESLLVLRERLVRPASLDADLIRIVEPNADSTLAKLVLEGILSIEHEGAFVSGPRAFHAVVDAFNAGSRENITAQLSARALETIASLKLDNAAGIAARLYLFNRYPASPKWRHKLRSRPAVESLLGIDYDMTIFEKVWQRQQIGREVDDWIIWRNRERMDTKRSFKLYISPKCEDLISIFPKLVRVLGDIGPSSFKVGGNVYGLLRPDKMVIYFDEAEQLKRASTIIERIVHGCRVHGVPFSGQLDVDGVLSCGMDPLKEPRGSSTSWRMDIAERLAAAILWAQNDSECPLPPDQFAIARLALDGFDTLGWMPSLDHL